jgi:ribose transport system permease protein
LGIVFVERFGILLVWAMVLALFAIIEPSQYLSVGNMANIFGSHSVLVVVTLALIVPLTAGDYDLSVGGVVALTAMIVAVLNGQHGWPIGAAIAVALGAGLLVGLFNGLVITIFGIDSLIVTLGSQTLLSGLVLWISESQTVSGISNKLVKAVVGSHSVRDTTGVSLRRCGDRGRLVPLRTHNLWPPGTLYRTWP